MEDLIKLLPDNVANQIAAGEVVQRPSSAVKELLENAVDSGATEINVVVKDAGKTLIQVIDNGCGMSETDARIAFERHATSKISDINDLFQIHTMGFRGEALASIAAVAQVNIKTKITGEEIGSEIEISATEVLKQEAVNCSPGTNISVKNLFFNVPARRKFLKTNTTELKHIINEFQRVALANSSIKFTLKHNNSQIYELPQATIKQRIINLMGKTLNNQLVNIDTETSIVKIKGYVSKPEFAKKTSSEQFFFVNDRYMRHPSFHRAIMNAYERLIPPDTTPSYFVFFEVDPKSIDINIHPTKTEIKFVDERSVFQMLQSGVRQALGISNFMPSIDFETAGSVDIPPAPNNKDFYPSKSFSDFGYNPYKDKNLSNIRGTEPDGWQNFFSGLESEKTVPEQTDIFKSSTDLVQNDKKTISQLKNKYILTNVKSGLMIIDQQRAHQRILYEDYLKTVTNDKAVAQKQLFADKLELSSADFNILMEIKDDLNTLGVDTSNFGNNTVLINSVPADSVTSNGGELLTQILEYYKKTEMDVKINAKENIAKSVALAGSIRYGKALTEEEMFSLTNRLFSCKEHSYSPDGKVIINIITMDEIEKRLK